MSEKKYDMLELLDIANGTDETRVSAAISGINKRKQELFSSICKLETEANKILNDFYSRLNELDNVKKEFLKIQARNLYSELIKKLYQSMDYIHDILESIDLSNKDELLADKPFEDVFNVVNNEICNCKSRNKVFAQNLMKLLSSNNLLKVSLIEKSAEKIILSFEQLKVYRSLQESEIATIHLYKEIDHRLFDGDLYYTFLYISEDDEEPFAIFTNSIVFYKRYRGCKDDALLIEEKIKGSPNNYINEFVNGIGEMIMLLVSHIEVNVVSGVFENTNDISWTITLKLNK